MKRTTQIAALFIIAFICFFWLLAAPASKSTARNEKELPGGGGWSDAKTIYAKDCATCHGKDGRARTFKAKFNRARNLTDAAWQAGVSDERLFNSIMNGRGKMPAFGKKLSEADVNSLVTYVRGLQKQTVQANKPGT